MTLLDWHRLGQDHLYIRSTFGSDSYSIWATNLSRLWHEELDRDDIVWQANKYRIQIDIGVADNFSILLKHLASSVKAGNFEVPDKKSNRLELKALIELPEPLPEASWTFKLELQDADDFRKQVTIPLFEQIQTHQRNEADLIQRIEDKDHIVDKLLDALDKYKVDLSGIFPALVTQGPARKVSTRAEAETRIPALRRFDPQLWHQDHQDEHSSATLTPRKVMSIPVASARLDEEVSISTQVSYSASHIEHQNDSSQAHDNCQDTEQTHSIPSRGIKRTIGSRNPPSSPLLPALEDSLPSEPEKTPSPIAAPRRGIKRTIGSRKHVERTLSPTQADAIENTDRASSAFPSPLKETPQDTNRSVFKEQEEAELDPERALRRADDKRKALQRQLAQSPPPKPKKRKF
jgi:hypothetical protein